MRTKALLLVTAIVALLGARMRAADDDGKIKIQSVPEVAAKNPIAPAVGRAITPVADGQFSSLTVWQFKTGIGSHLHREHDEVIYCTEGKGIARLGSEKIKMKAGDFVVIPPNMPHGVVVTSKKPMRGISVFSPRFDGKDRIPVAELP